MKKDTLQSRVIYRVAFQYAENHCEIITIGANSDDMFVYRIVKEKAREIFDKKYPNIANKIIRVL